MDLTEKPMTSSPAICLIVGVLLVASACTRKTPIAAAPPPEAFSTSHATLREGKSTTMAAVSFLEERVKSDAEDFVALNKLAQYYLQLHRETEDINYLPLALKAAKASLQILPADQNLTGLGVLAHAELQTHNFRAARDLARELTEYQPQKAFGYQLLGDALLELGEYEEATKAYERMAALAPGTVETEARLGQLERLRGNLTGARQHYAFALTQAKNGSLPSNETIAWCHWQLGELLLASGDAAQAVRHYRNAISTVENYPHAVVSLARLRASQGDLQEAIKIFESIVGQEPHPDDAIALGDLFKLAGRQQEAEKLFELAERSSQGDTLRKALYNRHLILFWADHDRNVDQAYERARREYDVRRDVFGADALAWSALKAGKIPEARVAINDALRLGTQDARLFYHAGMIARAAGDTTTARNYLRRSLELNPHFDPVQAAIAKKALEQ